MGKNSHRWKQNAKAGHKWGFYGSEAIDSKDFSRGYPPFEVYYKCNKCGMKLPQDNITPGGHVLQTIPTCTEIRNLNTVREIMES